MNLDDLGEIHPDSYAFPSIKLPLINARIPPVPPEMYYSQRQHQQFYQQTTVPPTTMQTGTQLINRGTEPLQAVPRIHLATPEVITVELAREVLINLTTNKNIRLCQANRIALSSTRLGHGQICALHHPNFGYVQVTGDMFGQLCY